MKDKINDVLIEMATQLDLKREELLQLNKIDIEHCDKEDKSLYDRLFIDHKKIDGMIDSLQQVIQKESPLNKTLYSFQHDNGLSVSNKTVPFGTIMIIYESRPDVTIEATATALKSGNKILLKGGKEAKHSNLFLHACWLQALSKVGLQEDQIRYLNMDRVALQQYLKEPDTKIDLIVPRGGMKLIEYVKSVAQCPVLVSGRGNNFCYVSESANLNMALDIIVQSKISKISACNALDKVLIHERVSEKFIQELKGKLLDNQVEIIQSPTDSIWKEEFLDKKIVLATVPDLNVGIEMINKYSGGHSACIISEQEAEVNQFMQAVDCAAVYHNASTRFTDGYQFGLGAEMAISTEKLHHRGPLGLEELVTNKWYIKGNGQTR
ncbi:MAG: glutamate-5-semialdehyde dehydrogenase [Aureispira sp.]